MFDSLFLIRSCRNCYGWKRFVEIIIILWSLDNEPAHPHTCLSLESMQLKYFWRIFVAIFISFLNVKDHLHNRVNIETDLQNVSLARPSVGGRTQRRFLCELLVCVGCVLGLVLCELCYKWLLVKLVLRRVSPNVSAYGSWNMRRDLNRLMSD